MRRIRWSATRRMGLLLGTMTLLQVVPPAQAAPTPQTFTIEVGRELGLTGSDGEPLSAATLRFLPEELQVHKGDLLHFVSEVPLQGIAFLPPSVGPECEEWTDEAAAEGRCAPRQWIDDHAFSLESRWYPVTLDPDEKYVKVNNAAAFPPFPACGNRTYVPPGPIGPDPLPRPSPVVVDQRPCEFPLTSEQQAMQDRRWGFTDPENTPEGARGVLGSGLAQGGPDRTLDFRVKVAAESGTVFWAVSLFAKEAHLRIEVVPDTQGTRSPDEVLAAGEAQFKADQETALRLDSELANYHNLLSHERGVNTWEALLGVEEGPVAIRQAYPKVLNIKQGDKVKWTITRVLSLVHTVTFPGDLAFKKPFFTQECDLDGDEIDIDRDGRAEYTGTAPDLPSELPAPFFCPGGFRQVEFDLSDLVGGPFGDGKFTGGADEEHSGIHGMAPSLVGKESYQTVQPRTDYELEFAAKSGPEGFVYACALHGAIGRAMSGRVVVH